MGSGRSSSNSASSESRKGFTAEERHRRNASYALFVSAACYLDNANGASVASRALMEALARRGFPVEILCGPILELRYEVDLDGFLAARAMALERCNSHGASPAHLASEHRGVPVTLMLGLALPRSYTAEETGEFLRLFEVVSARFRPDVLVSYGGGPLTRELFRQAKSRGVVTVFTLHNLRYGDPTAFADVDAVLVASRFAAEHYKATLGLRCTVLPNLIDWERVRVLDRRPRYAVFVNPTVEKGVGVLARIADELGRVGRTYLSCSWRGRDARRTSRCVDWSCGSTAMSSFTSIRATRADSSAWHASPCYPRSWLRTSR
jgi:hypothetical protein